MHILPNHRVTIYLQTPESSRMGGVKSPDTRCNGIRTFDLPFVG